MQHKRVDLLCPRCGKLEKDRHHLAKVCLKCSSRGYREDKDKPKLERLKP
jgi:uncharacterized C2H2 Zn-finger protein